MPISIIPMLGVDRRFWGQPDQLGARRFATQILDDLIYEARQHPTRSPLLGLFVHPHNSRAIAAYHRVGFQDFSLTYADSETQTVYKSMLLKLGA